MKFSFVLALLFAPLVSFAKAPSPTPVAPPVEVSPIDSPEWALVVGTPQERTDLRNSTILALRATQFADCENHNGLLVFRDRSYVDGTSDIRWESRAYRHASNAPILKFVSGTTSAPREGSDYSETTIHLAGDRRAIRSITIETFRWIRQNVGLIDQPDFQWARRSTSFQSCSN